LGRFHIKEGKYEYLNTVFNITARIKFDEQDDVICSNGTF